MLDCLPAEEAAYYSLEANVVDPAGKSQVVFNEVEDRYGFIGGAEAEYLAYFHRPDLPQNLWAWTHPDDVKAVAGFAVVAKKSGKLRKLLMQCAANYMWQCVEELRLPPLTYLETASRRRASTNPMPLRQLKCPIGCPFGYVPRRLEPSLFGRSCRRRCVNECFRGIMFSHATGAWQWDRHIRCTY